MSDLKREPERDTDVLVIGAGIAGVIAATELTRAGARVLVLDKGRSVGGRLASRRIGEATFDYGAQFITARTPWFSGVIDECRDAGVLSEWCRGFAESADRHARWRGHPTIAAVATHLARGLEVLLERQVVALRYADGRWIAVTQLGEVLRAAAVVLTPPAPQSLAIMDAGGLSLEAEIRTRLEGIEYRALPRRDDCPVGPVAARASGRPGARRRTDRLDRRQSAERDLGDARCHHSRHACLQRGALGAGSAAERTSTAGRRGAIAGRGHPRIPGARLALQQAEAG